MRSANGEPPGSPVAAAEGMGDALKLSTRCGGSRPGADQAHDLDLTTTGEHLAALHLEAANELRNVRVAKGIVDLGVNAGLLRWRVSCYCY